MALLTAKRAAAVLGSAALTATALLAAPAAAQANSPVCTATYANLDLANRSASWGVTCSADSRIYVDAQLWYDNQTSVNLPESGSRVVKAGETWTVWTQDNTHTGAAWHGVLHIVKENNGPATVLAHVSK
ncbi:hypothetical protein [Longispora albida]|uniref:hypothetical protein n=1 Tax=Longispora albida TaxID=203523 RepID=UPI00036479E5|nr:hypothetical protein [Longispora albida]